MASILQLGDVLEYVVQVDYKTQKCVSKPSVSGRQVITIEKRMKDYTLRALSFVVQPWGMNFDK